MENVGSIEYDARINTKHLKSDSREVDSIAKNTGDSLGDNTERGSSKASAALATFGAIAKTTAVAAAVALSAGIFSAAKASWEQADAVQQATVALNAYETDGTKVNSVLKDLISYARSDMGVLFNRKDLFASAQSLKIYGDNTEDLTDHVKILSRSVGLGLSTWEGLNNVIGRVGSTGKLYADDLQYLQNAGFKLDGSLSGTTQTFESLFKLLDAGIPTDALEGQSDTIKGIGIRFETAFRGIGDALLGVDKETSQFKAGSLGEGIVNSIKTATDFLKRDDVRSVVAGIGSAIVTAFTVGGQAVSTFSKAVSPLIEWFKQNLLPIIQQLAQFVGGVFAEAWKQITISFQNLQTVLAPFSEQLKILGIIVGIALIAPLVIVIATLVAIVVAITLVVTAIAFIIGKMAEFANFVFTTFGNVANFFSDVFTRAVNSIKSVFGTLGGFFRGVWDTIVNIFGNVGTSIGNAIGNTFKSTVNSVIRGAVSIINGFIGAINGVVDTINKIPGVSLGKVGTLPIPQMASGGIVTSPTLAMIGEGRESEAVIPLSKLDAMMNQPKSNGSGHNINISLSLNGIMTRSKSDEREVARTLIKRLNEELQAKGVNLIGDGSL